VGASGSSRLRRSVIRKAIRRLGRSGKKLPQRLTEALAQFDQALAQNPIKLMFQDAARFGRINDVRHCWALRPSRPVCQAVPTHEYT
jgi:hypothetical protein